MYYKNIFLALFQVGCGAIGCEMLKNYATLGIGTSDSGQVISACHSSWFPCSHLDQLKLEKAQKTTN